MPIHDCMLLNGSNEVETSSLKGIRKVCKGINGRKLRCLILVCVEITIES